MKIKHYLAILILTCLGLGYGMEALLSNYQQKTQNLVELEYQYNIATRDIDRLKNDSLQYIISIDLILGSDQNYLLPGALRMGDLLIQQINAKKDSLLQKRHTQELANAKNIISKTLTLLNTSKTLSYENRESQLYTLLTEFDTLSDSLTTILENITQKLHTANEEHRSVTKKYTQQNIIHSYSIRVFYGVFVFFIWIWIYKSISKPIEMLIQHVKTIEEDEDHKIEHSGPKEVKFLSTQIESTEKKLLLQALHDPLTNLYNRREFSRKTELAFAKNKKINHQIHCFINKIPVQNGRIKALLTEAPESQHDLCVCVIDIDRFKAVNDNCGHAAGDELLIIAANEIEETAGKNNIIGRLGGDEFGILFINTPKDECIKRIDSILNKIRSIHFERGGAIYRISASIGMTFVTDASIPSSEWINTADAGCFVAKDCGRDNRQIMILNDDRLNSIRNDTKVYNDVIKALEEDRFVLYHQRITGLQENNRGEHYFEILIRMIAEDNSIVAPCYFMNTVERFDLITRLDRWVVSNTIAWLEAHPEKTAMIDTCSINLSGKSLASKEMHHFLKDALRNTSVPAHKICFEITETAAVNDINQAQRLIKNLRSIGCRFALDDFGSGLSSFAYLQNLAVDAIKIDGLFVKNLASNDFDQVMVKSINELAKNVNMKTIAEFVETKEIADILQRIGIHYAQGYHFHQPEPLDAVQLSKISTIPSIKDPSVTSLHQ
jgi:diguanylate cyclase (GGDEF)-like protein